MSLVRVDCHLHTVASGDAVTTLDELAERAAQESLDVVFITDHNEISAAVTAASDLGVRVIVGEEIRTPDGDIIGLFLTERVPYVLPVAEVVARIRSQGGLVYAPHPFDEGRSSLGRVLPGLCAAGAVDIVEVFNAKIETQGPNERAARPRDGLRPAGRGRLGRARPGRHRRGLPGDARLRRPGQLPGRAGGRADNRGVPPARPPLPAPPRGWAAPYSSTPYRPIRLASRSRW